MSDILTIRLPAGEKAKWEQAASRTSESVAEYIREAVRQRTERGTRESPWDTHVGSANVDAPAPTNANIRRSFAQHSRRKR